MKGDAMLARLAACLLLAAACIAAEPPALKGTWVGAQPAIAQDATLVLAFINANGSC
jgi:hypothetical protein